MIFINSRQALSDYAIRLNSTISQYLGTPTPIISALVGFTLVACNFPDGNNHVTDPISVEIIIPDDQPTIQAGITAASNGDLVVVRPGIYFENIDLQGKSITLTSWFYKTNDKNFIKETVIDGQGATVITANSGSRDSTISGLTIRNGDDGIRTSAVLNILNNRITQNGDGIDYESGGGRCSLNTFISNRDDGIDLDGSVAVLIDNNSILSNGDDGIEIRLHPYLGPTLLISVKDNNISGNAEDGIQIIDYDGVSDRLITIERNIIDANKMVGIGMMADGNTVEDFSGAPVSEAIRIYNNTISDNNYGLTGGANLIALNNIIYNTQHTAIRNTSGESLIAYQLFWSNSINYENSIIDLASSLSSDPLINDSFELMPGSPAIDSGTYHFVHNSEIVFDIPASDYSGSAPDLGAIESM